MMITTTSPARSGWRMVPPTCEHCGRDGATIAGLCITCQVTRSSEAEIKDAA